jgi:adenine-specific DNA-methyltransferase
LGGGFAYLRTNRIPVSRVFNDIQHEQVWRALQLTHGLPLAGYNEGALLQLAGNADDRLLYVPKLSEPVLEEVARQAGRFGWAAGGVFMAAGANQAARGSVQCGL